MLFDTLSPKEIEGKKQELLNQVPKTGSIGNKTLKEKLGNTWSADDLYWKIRNLLIDEGSLEKGRGNGGSVKRVIQQADKDIPPDSLNESAQNPYEKELDLYEPIAKVLSNEWAKDKGFDNYLIEITAKQGSKQTGGKWTRPDITAIGCKKFLYLPSQFLDVITFEIKPTNTIDVSAVYEALAHRRSATRAYVIAHIPKKVKSDYKEIMEAVYDEAKKFGVGVIVVDDPTDFYTWVTWLEADRVEPDPIRLNEFIAQQFPQEKKDKIIKWFK